MTVADIAAAELGVREPDAFQRFSDGERVNWCAAFVLWCYQRAGIHVPGNRWRNRAVWQLQRELEAMGWAVVSDHPRPGDIAIQTRTGSRVGDQGILEARSPGHVGIVEGPVRGGIDVIEGNVRDAVRRVRHWAPYHRILGFYRPPESK